jgi:hypothetical protein
MREPTFSEQLKTLRAAYDAGNATRKREVVGELWGLCLQLNHHAAAAVPWLTKLVESRDRQIVNYASEALGRCGTSGVQKLQRLLSHSSEFLRCRCAYGIGQSGDRSPRTLRLLGAMLASGSVDERIAALSSLSTIAQISQSPRALAPLAKQLLKALDDPDRDVVSWVPDTLNAIGLRPKQFIELALNRIDPPVGKPRYEMLSNMVEMLEKVDARDYLPRLLSLVRRDEALATWFIDVFGGIGPAAAEAVPILEKLSSGDEALRAGCALLKIDGRPGVLKTLARQLPKSPDEIAGILCDLGPAGAPLAGALAKVVDANFDEPDWDLMWALSDALAAIESTEPIAVKALRKALSHESGRVKGSALRGLQKAGPAARAALPDLRRLEKKMTGESRRNVRETIAAIEKPAN